MFECRNTPRVVGIYLLVPRSEVAFHRNHITVIGNDDSMKELYALLLDTVDTFDSPYSVQIDTSIRGATYFIQIVQGLSEMA